MALIHPTKLEPLLQGPLEATGLFVEFFGTTLRHGTYLKLKTGRISNDLDDFVEGDIVVGRIISTSVSGGNKGNSGHPDVAKVNIFRVAKASGSRRPPPTLDNEIDTLSELVQSPRCIEIGEEDIEDLAFILTLKDVGKSAEHIYQGISNCYLLRYFDNGQSLEAIPDGLCLPFYSSYGTDHKHDFALSVWSTILAMKTSMVAMLARAGGKLPKFLLRGSKPISTGCNHDVWLYFCRRLKDPYNRPATQKRIIKKTVQGCKAACVEVPRDSVSVDVIRLKTEPEIDLWIELVCYTGIVSCRILRSVWPDPSKGPRKFQYNDELNVIRSTTVDFGRWSTLVTSYRGGVDLEYKRNISLTLKSRCTRYKCQSTDPQTGFPADFPRVLEPFFAPVVEQIPNDSLISKWYRKNADPDTKYKITSITETHCIGETDDGKVGEFLKADVVKYILNKNI
jgi:hypothetical protein